MLIFGLRLCAVLLFVFALAGCSPARLLDSLVPTGGYRLIPSQPYASGPRHSLDVYLPETAALDAPAPVVVFFYGGNWRSGDKETYRFVGQALAARGIAVAIPDYRVYPEVRFPAFIEDGAQAIAWVRNHAGELGLDPGRIFLMGHSAGAYNAAMLAIDERWLAAVGVDARRDIRGLIGLAGPYDFLPLGEDTRNVLGTVPDRQTQPISYVDGAEVPMLLATGLSDTTVFPRNTTSLAGAVRRAGGRAETQLYEGVGHVGLVISIASPLQGGSRLVEDIVGWIRRVGGTAAGS